MPRLPPSPEPELVLVLVRDIGLAAPILCLNCGCRNAGRGVIPEKGVGSRDVYPGVVVGAGEKDCREILARLSGSTCFL